MSTTQTHRSNSPELDRPTCEQCGSRMWLRRIAHDGPAREFRIFECPVCEVSTGASR